MDPKLKHFVLLEYGIFLTKINPEGELLSLSSLILRKGYNNLF